MSTLACIDLGTNTFHLLICNADNKAIKEIFRERRYVILAEDGIELIGDKPMKRAIQAVDRFKEILDGYSLDAIRILGTEALRTAKNGHLIAAYISETLGVTTEIIEGEREADLIYKGTKQIVDLSKGWFCIMDIGGGSVEFIITKDDEIQFVKSFKVGVTVLYNRFHHTEPISPKEIDSLKEFLGQELKELTDFLKTIDRIHLVGASGSYEVLQNVIEGEIKSKSLSRFSPSQFDALFSDIIMLNLEERRQVPGIPQQRTKLIIVAFLLIDFIIKSTTFESIIVSPYALKEGLIAEMLETI